MTREEKTNLLNELLEYEEKNDIGLLTRAERREFQQWISEALEQEPRKGHWITRPHVYGITYCSECDFELKIDDTNYCPNCGAKMEKRLEEVEK